MMVVVAFPLSFSREITGWIIQRNLVFITEAMKRHGDDCPVSFCITLSVEDHENGSIYVLLSLTLGLGKRESQFNLLARFACSSTAHLCKLSGRRRQIE